MIKPLEMKTTAVNVLFYIFLNDDIWNSQV